MSHVEHSTQSPGGASTLILGGDADPTVVEQRSTRAAGLTRHEQVALAVVGGGFVAALAALLWFVPVQRDLELGVLALYVVVYALVSRIEFEIFTGSSIPTQLVLIPMVFVLPLRLVPLAVAGGLVLGYTVDWLSGRSALDRIALSLVGSWHAVGPVLVLALAGERVLEWSNVPIYLTALGAQFAFEIVAVGVHVRLAQGIGLGQLLPHLWRTQLVDAALAPAGLAFAYAAQSQPYTLLLVLPLVGLLWVFSQERRARIDNALELSTAYRGTAFLLGDVVEADDAYTGLHSRDVVELSVAVADALGVSERERRDTEFAALLHDVGKIRVPSEIVNKPGALTPEERAVMERHTIEGQLMLERVGGLLGAVGRIVRSCHEHFDGTGYPDGLAGEEIPLVARIVSCCDAFSAMTTDRSYRTALPPARAVAELEANAGTQFDPLVVAALVQVLKHGTLDRPRVVESHAA